jgi:hypothetical protein
MDHVRNSCHALLSKPHVHHHCVFSAVKKTLNRIMLRLTQPHRCVTTMIIIRLTRLQWLLMKVWSAKRCSEQFGSDQLFLRATRNITITCKIQINGTPFDFTIATHNCSILILFHFLYFKLSFISKRVSTGRS